jgi:hypothetical protein
MMPEVGWEGESIWRDLKSHRTCQSPYLAGGPFSIFGGFLPILADFINFGELIFPF